MPRFVALLLLLLAAAAPPPPVSPDQAAAALAVIENPQSRDAFIATLRAIIAAGPQPAPAKAGAAAPAAHPGTAPGTSQPAAPSTAPAPAAAAPTIPLQPGSLGAQFLVKLSDALAAARRALAAATRAVISLPLLSIWLMSVRNDPNLHRELFAAGWRLVLVIGAGLVAEWLAILALARARAGLERLARRRDAEGNGPDVAALDDPIKEGEARAEAGETEGRALRQPVLHYFRRAGLAFSAFLLDLVPVLVFAAVANGLLGVGLGAETIARLVILAVANAYVLTRVLLSIVRLLMGDESPALRLLPVQDAGARYAMLWAKRIVGVSVFGYAGAEAALLFGLYGSLHLALLKLVALVVHVFIVVIVLQKRRTVRAFLRATPDARGPIAMLRNVVASVWHYIAIFYVMALWVVWAVGIRNGFVELIRICAAALLVLVLAYVANRLILRSIERRFRLSEAWVERYPGFERRARHYLHGTKTVVSIAIAVVGLVVVLELWGIDAIAWFSSGSLGGRALQALAVIGITVLAALLVWEVANTAIERHLARLSRQGQAARSARLNTLLPMLRTTLLVAIGIFVGLMALSQIGLDIAPLLAGAGVVGIAIGFGSQKLVQDVITGLFLLLENAMQVGDVVTLGGLSGVVENLSVRTIRLRASDGSVHVIPFSAVSTVTNQTRDFGYAVFNISVAYKEDVDAVIGTLKEIVAEMRKEPEWAAMIRDNLEVWGLDQFAASSMVIACRVRTGPAQRWAVAREFNRRMKRRFDELGIDMPYPTQKMVLEQAIPLYRAEEAKDLPTKASP